MSLVTNIMIQFDGLDEESENEPYDEEVLRVQKTSPVAIESRKLRQTSLNRVANNEKLDSVIAKLTSRDVQGKAWKELIVLGARVVPEIFRAVDQLSAERRGTATLLLRTVVENTPSALHVIIHELRKSRDPDLHTFAIQSVAGASGAPQQRIQFLIEELKSTDPEIRAQSASALGVIADASALQYLKEALERETNLSVKGTIVDSMNEISSYSFDELSFPDSRNIAKLHEITERLCGNRQRFAPISGGVAGRMWGGSKVPECNLYGAAFNYIPLDKFFEELEKLTWTTPNLFRLFVQSQDDNAFGVWVLRKGKLVCVCEPSQE